MHNFPLNYLNPVPVIDVHKDNLDVLWPYITNSVKEALFIAVDVELSGLGNRAELMTKIIEDRYKVVARVARTRAILSFGLSCFRPKFESPTLTSAVAENDVSGPSSIPGPTPNKICTYDVQTYNITLLCTEDYMVEPASLQFLVQHGFDFNKQYAQGVPYQRGEAVNSKKAKSPPKSESMRNLFSLIIGSKKSVVMHNGFVDLIFLYQHLYTEAPKGLQTFVADLYEMFSGGIFDTKYIAEFKLRHQATYLEYVFRKMQWLMDDRTTENRPRVFITFPEQDATVSPYAENRDLSLTKYTGHVHSKEDVCERYANHGWCSNGGDCKRLHDVCAIISMQRATAKRNRPKNLKRKPSDSHSTATSAKLINICPPKDSDETVEIMPPAIEPSEVQLDCNSADAACLAVTSDATENQNGVLPVKVFGTSSNDRFTLTVKSSTHRAGYDAFMTGYIFAAYLATLNPLPDLHQPLPHTINQLDIINRVYLSGKDHPLTIQLSAYTSTSKEHRTKFSSINNV